MPVILVFALTYAIIRILQYFFDEDGMISVLLLILFLIGTGLLVLSPVAAGWLLMIVIALALFGVVAVIFVSFWKEILGIIIGLSLVGFMMIALIAAMERT